jgi:hypothetical protein
MIAFLITVATEAVVEASTRPMRTSPGGYKLRVRYGPSKGYGVLPTGVFKG